MGTVQVLPVKVLSCRNVDCFDGSFLLLDAGKRNCIVPLAQQILSLSAAVSFITIAKQCLEKILL